MKLSDLNKLFFFLIIFINFSNSYAEEEVDIWKKIPLIIQMKMLKNKKKKFKVL